MSRAPIPVSATFSARISQSTTPSVPLSNLSLVTSTKIPPSTFPSETKFSASLTKPESSFLSMSSVSTKGVSAESTGGNTGVGTQTSSSSPSKTLSTNVHPPTTSSNNSASEQSDPTGKASPQASTKISVIHIDPSTTRTLTSTITDAPISTFSTPVAISVTNSVNGKIALSTPLAVTVLSTSTAAGGDFVTYTHVIANPTSFQSDVTSSGFLNNRGAVAGVFISVGVVVITVSVFLFICIRQRRRISRRRRWLEGMQPQYIPDPFEDGTETREVRSLDGSGPLISPFSDSKLEIERPSTRASHRLSVVRKPVPELEPEARDAFDPDRIGYVNVQRAVNRDSILMSKASIAPSSPSIYPVSLPDEDAFSDGQEATTGHSSDSQRSTHYLVSPPPRPPRSHLRLSTVQPGQIYPTPQTSLSAASREQLSSPESEQGHLKGGRHPIPILSRRTLLSVQPRSSPRSSPELDH